MAATEKEPMGINTPWRCVLSIGAMECVWLGVAMCLSPYYNVAPALFSPIHAAYVIPVGIVCIVAGIIGFVRPDVMGGGALMLVCGLRITQSITVRNLYPIGVWLILLLALVLVVIRAKWETQTVGKRSLGDVMAHLDRRAVQQAEERERQTREGERQTTEADRQTIEAERQTLEADRLRTLRLDGEGERQTAEGDRQTVEGDRQTREGERQTIEGERLDKMRDEHGGA